MIGFGCLAPLVLFVAGAVIGHIVIGSSGVPWGAGLGFLFGMGILGFSGWILGKVRKR